MYGAYINVPLPGRGETFGEYMPSEGILFGATVNWFSNTSTNYKVFMVNYGPNISKFSALIVGTGGAGTHGSMALWNQNIPFARNDYIGIWVAMDPPLIGKSGPNIVIEGTIYFKIS